MLPTVMENPLVKFVFSPDLCTGQRKPGALHCRKDLKTSAECLEFKLLVLSQGPKDPDPSLSISSLLFTLLSHATQFSWLLFQKFNID